MHLQPQDHLILDHYKHYWGSPIRIHEFDLPQVPVGIRPLFVGEFYIRANGLTMYASIGMSRMPMALPTTKTEHRVEMFLSVFQPSPTLPEIVAMTAAYPHIGRTYLGLEHTVPIGDKILPNSMMTTFIFCVPYYEPPEFRVIEMGDHHVQMLWAIPLSESERSYKVEHGWDALMKMFGEQHVAVANLLRKPAI